MLCFNSTTSVRDVAIMMILIIINFIIVILIVRPVDIHADIDPETDSEAASMTDGDNESINQCQTSSVRLPKTVGNALGEKGRLQQFYTGFAGFVPRAVHRGASRSVIIYSYYIVNRGVVSARCVLQRNEYIIYYAYYISHQLKIENDLF